MPVNAIAENVLGTIGTIFWTCQILPQIYKSWREKSTEGLSAWLMFIWAISGIFLGVYVVVQDISIPLILQPQLFTTLAVVSWMQCLYYSHKRTKTFCFALFVAFMSAFAASEMGLSIVVKTATINGNPRPLQFFGIFSAVLISLALIPQYVEIWRRKEVVGLSVPFMVIDLSGAVFCMLSLVFKAKFDAVAAVTYIAVMILDGIIVLAAIILNPRAKKRRAADAAAKTPIPPSKETEVTLPSPTLDTSTLGDELPSPVTSKASVVPWDQDLEVGRVESKISETEVQTPVEKGEQV